MATSRGSLPCVQGSRVGPFCGPSASGTAAPVETASYGRPSCRRIDGSRTEVVKSKAVTTGSHSAGAGIRQAPSLRQAHGLASEGLGTASEVSTTVAQRAGEALQQT